MTRATTNNHDALVNAATQLVAEFDQHGEVLQLGHDDDLGLYGPTSAIEQLRTALGTDWVANNVVRKVNAHDALVSVLEDIEWAGEGRTCPECDRCNGVVDEERGHENCVNTGHRDDCQLAAALEAAK